MNCFQYMATLLTKRLTVDMLRQIQFKAAFYLTISIGTYYVLLTSTLRWSQTATMCDLQKAYGSC